MTNMEDTNNSMKIFDRATVRSHRERAAIEADQFDFLHKEVADRMAERLVEISRSFKRSLQIGGMSGDMTLHPLLNAVGSELSISADLSAGMARRAAACANRHALALDEEYLPFAKHSFDLIFSPLCLHWVNDLPGSLIQINQALQPDGLFLGAIFGGETLKELRHCLLHAESEIMGGASPRISPFADVRDLGSLMQRAGFALPVTDLDTITVRYENPMRLLQDLRGMAESNAVLDRYKKITPKSVLIRACEIYMEQFAEDDGRVPATFQIIYMTGWHPDESQQKPLKPGSAKTSLAAALNGDISL